MSRIIIINKCEECSFWLTTKWKGKWKCPVNGHETRHGSEELFKDCPLDELLDEIMEDKNAV